jgi:hypothetical protein
VSGVAGGWFHRPDEQPQQMTEKELLAMKKILHLTVKKKWFDLIASGEKRREYREGKPYWKKRLLDAEGFAVEFVEIHFRNGYGMSAPLVRTEWRDLGVILGEGWQGEHGEIYKEGDFAIYIGRVLEVRA